MNTDLLAAAKAHLAARDALEGVNINALTADDPRFKTVADTLADLRAVVALAEAV